MIHSSTRSDNGFEINTRSVYDMCNDCRLDTILNYTPSKRAWNKVLSETIKDCAVVSIKNAVQDAADCNEEVTNLTLTVTGRLFICIV
jgi:hypothetical protein